jgi:glutathione S-transferase
LAWKLPDMKLYYSSDSPFARKVRVLLLERNAPHETELVDLWGAMT